MAKARDAFRTIGEVSEELDVPKHVLRFWESRFPQIKPMKRGGGRRFYRPDDVALLRGIHHLLHKSGYTIKGVQRILREDGVDHVKLTDGMTAPLAAARPPVTDTPPAPAKAAQRGKVRPTGASLSPGEADTVANVARELRACLDILRRAA